MKAEIILK